MKNVGIAITGQRSQLSHNTTRHKYTHTMDVDATSENVIPKNYSSDFYFARRVSFGEYVSAKSNIKRPIRRMLIKKAKKKSKRKKRRRRNANGVFMAFLGKRPTWKRKNHFFFLLHHCHFSSIVHIFMRNVRYFVEREKKYIFLSSLLCVASIAGGV